MKSCEEALGIYLAGCPFLGAQVRKKCNCIGEDPGRKAEEDLTLHRHKLEFHSNVTFLYPFSVTL